MTYYQLSRYGTNEIKTIEFVRVTAEFGFTASGRREKLSTTWDTWHPTKQEAIEYRRVMLTENLESARVEVARAERRLAKFDAEFPKVSGEAGR